MHRRKPELYWTYLKDYFVVAFLLSMFCWYMTWLRGPAALSFLIPVKTIFALITYAVHTHRKKREIYFYLNNGISARELMLTGLGPDLMLWAVVSTFIVQFTA